MSDDVVATINAILNGEDNFILLLQRPQLERIRDEIVALREKVFIFAASNEEEKINIRAEALEEAARLCERVPGDPKYGDFFAAAIRTLKERSE